MEKRNKIVVALLVASALIVLGAYFLFSDNSTPEQAFPDEPENEEEQTVLNFVTNHPDFQSAALEAVDGSNSSGTAYRLFSAGTFRHVAVADMPEPASGSSYEGWLVNPQTSEFFSTGVMERNEEGMWQLIYTAEQDYPEYYRVVITEETVVDEVPEIHILEGDF